MSEKAAKAERSRVIHALSLTYTSDGKVTVRGIPDDSDTAVAMVDDLFKAILRHFIERAVSGLDETKKEMTFNS